MSSVVVESATRASLSLLSSPRASSHSSTEGRACRRFTSGFLMYETLADLELFRVPASLAGAAMPLDRKSWRKPWQFRLAHLASRLPSHGHGNRDENTNRRTA